MFYSLRAMFLHCCSPVTDVGIVIVNIQQINPWLNRTHILRRARQVSVLLRPSYRCRYTNCKHPTNQPMVES